MPKMKGWLWGLVVLVVAACSSAPEEGTTSSVGEVTLNNYGPAPELTNAVWLNIDKPLRFADLRGKVVLIDFWTFG